MKRIVGLVRKAVEDYGMIENGDRVAVGVSGGKDSLVLLGALAALSKYYPKKFSVVGLTLDMGDDQDFSPIKKYCESLGAEYLVKKTNIWEVVFDCRKESNPCSLCAKLRRGALENFAKDEGCTKIALGHHNDDVLETFMLSLLYEGRINCFSPFMKLDKSGIYQIRPLIYVREGDIKGAVKRLNIPVQKSSCPIDGTTKRSEMKDLIAYMNKTVNPGMKKRLFTAIRNSGIDGWKSLYKDN